MNWEKQIHIFLKSRKVQCLVKVVLQMFEIKGAQKIEKNALKIQILHFWKKYDFSESTLLKKNLFSFHMPFSIFSFHFCIENLNNGFRRTSILLVFL